MSIPNDKKEEVQDDVLQKIADEPTDFTSLCAETSNLLATSSQEESSVVSKDSLKHDYESLIKRYPKLSDEEKIEEFSDFLSNNFDVIKRMIRASKSRSNSGLRTTSVADDLWVKLRAKPFNLEKYSDRGYASFRSCLKRVIINLIIDKTRNYSKKITQGHGFTFNNVGTLSFDDVFASIAEHGIDVNDSSYEEIANNFMSYIKERMSAKIDASGLDKWQDKKFVFENVYFKGQRVADFCSEFSSAKSTIYEYLKSVKELFRNDPELLALCEEYYALLELIRSERQEGVIANYEVPVKCVNRRADQEDD